MPDNTANLIARHAKKAGIKPRSLHQPLASTGHEGTFSQRCSNTNASGRLLRFACEFFASEIRYSLDFWELCFGGGSFRLFPNRLSQYRLLTDNTLIGMKKQKPHRGCEKMNMAGIHCPTKAKSIEFFYRISNNWVNVKPLNSMLSLHSKNYSISHS